MASTRNAAFALTLAVVAAVLAPVFHAVPAMAWSSTGIAAATPLSDGTVKLTAKSGTVYLVDPSASISHGHYWSYVSGKTSVSSSSFGASANLVGGSGTNGYYRRVAMTNARELHFDYKVFGTKRLITNIYFGPTNATTPGTSQSPSSFSAKLISAKKDSGGRWRLDLVTNTGKHYFPVVDSASSMTLPNTSGKHVSYPAYRMTTDPIARSFFFGHWFSVTTGQGTYDRVSVMRELN